jgi:phosphatidylinositol alpha-mannosyltransferase
LLFLGRIDEPRKGLQVLIGALEAIVQAWPDIRVLVAGPGDVKSVKASLPATVVDHVEFLGLISEEDKVRAFKSADAYVAPNTGGESFGIVLLEAMSAGTPVIASDLDAFSQVLKDGECGVLFANGDSASLARAVSDLLADPQRAAVYVENGTWRADQFDWATVARDVERVYDAVRQPGVTVAADFSGQFFGRMG